MLVTSCTYELYSNRTEVDVTGIFSTVCRLRVGRDSAVCIATRYGVGGPGIESLWGRDFPHPSRPPLGSTQPTTQRVLGLARG